MRKAEKAPSNGGLISKILNKLSKLTNDVDKINSDLTPIKLESSTISIGANEAVGITFSIPNDKKLIGVVGFHGGTARTAVTSICPSEDLKSIEMWILNTYTYSSSITPRIYVLVR